MIILIILLSISLYKSLLNFLHLALILLPYCARPKDHINKIKTATNPQTPILLATKVSEVVIPITIAVKFSGILLSIHTRLSIPLIITLFDFPVPI